MDLSYGAYQKLKSVPAKAPVGTTATLSTGAPLDLSYKAYATALTTSKAPTNTPPPVDTTTVGDRFVKAMPATTQGLAGLQQDPLNLKAGISKALPSMWDTIKSAGTSEWQNAANFISSFTSKNRPTSEKVGTGLKVLSGAGNLLFSPLSALFAGADKVPVLGSISKAIGTGFTALGEGASNITNAGIDAIPDTVLSQQAKENIKPGLDEIAALVAQIGVGELTAKVLTRAKKTELTQKYGEQDATTIINKVEEIVSNKKVGQDVGAPKDLSYENFKASEAPKSVPVTADTTTFSPEVQRTLNLQSDKVAPTEAPKVAPVETPTLLKDGGTPKDVVTVNDKQFSLSGKSLTEFNKAQETYNKRVEVLKKDLTVSSPARVEYATKQLKAEGMKFSALKRQLTGDLTSIEINNQIKQEQSNYLRKKVNVDINGKNIEGTINSAPSFGRYKVSLNDGTVVSKLASDIKDPRSYAEIRRGLLARSEAKLYSPVKISPEAQRIINMKQSFATSQPLNAVKSIPLDTPKTMPARGAVKETPKQEAPNTKTTTPEPKKLDPLASSVFERMKAENPQALEGDLNYDPIKLKEDAQRAVDLIAKDKQEAYRVAMGAETRADVTQTAVNIAMSEKALADGNLKLYSQLVKNRSLAQTRRGQEIVSERGSISDNSVSTFVKEVLAARLDKMGKQYFDTLKEDLGRVADKTKAIKIIDKEVAKVSAKLKGKQFDIKQAQSLIDSLAC